MKASDETTSLLHASSSDVEADLEQPISPQPSEAEEPWTRTHKATVILAALFVICFQIADILRFTPSMRLYELGLCRRYYQQHDPSLISPDGHVAEQYCKISSIQEDLSALKGWMSTLEGLVGLILVLPYGALAEVKGAKLVAMLNLAGYALFCAWTLVVCFFWETLPIELVALAPLFRAVGGGAPVASAVTLAIVANAAPSSKRSTMFFFMGAAELVTEMIAPLMSTAFLAKGFIYTPILLGFIFEALAFVMIHAVPMDVIRQKGKDHSIERTESSQSLLGVSKAPEDRGGHFLSYLGDPRELLTRSIIILLGCFTVTKLGRQMLEMLVQYMSKRYGWSFAQANIAFSVRATGSLILLLAVLPLLKSRLQHYYQLHSDRTDFWIAFVSTLMLFSGSIVMGLAGTIPLFFTGLVIFTFGSGGRQALQAYLTSFVDREDLTRLYTYIALCDGFGSALGAALVNGALKEGIHKGASWLGLPFFVAAGAYALCLTGLFVSR